MKEGPVRDALAAAAGSSAICMKAEETLGRGQKTEGGNTRRISAAALALHPDGQCAVVLGARPGDDPLGHFLLDRAGHGLRRAVQGQAGSTSAAWPR